MVVPKESTESQGMLEAVRNAVKGDGRIVMVEQPVVLLGNREYLIEPLVSSMLSCRIEGDCAVDELKPGDEFALIPGVDDTVVTAAVIDWAPRSAHPFEAEED